MGILKNFIESNIEASGEEVNAVKKPSASDVKKALIENGAVIEENVIFREIRHAIMKYYCSDNEFNHNYMMVILSSGDTVLARTSE